MKNLKFVIIFTIFLIGSSNCIWDQLSEYANTLYNDVKENANVIYENVKEHAHVLYNNVKENAGSIYDDVKENASSIYDNVKENADHINEVISKEGNKYKELVNSVSLILEVVDANIWTKSEKKQKFIKTIYDSVSIVYDLYKKNIADSADSVDSVDSNNDLEKTSNVTKETTDSTNKETNSSYENWKDLYNTCNPFSKFIDSEIYSENFFLGLLEGFSSVPLDQNKCSLNLQYSKNIFIPTIQELIKAYNKGEDFFSHFLTIYKHFDKFKHITSCRFEKLAYEASSIWQVYGTVKVVYRAYSNIHDLYNNIEKFCKTESNEKGSRRAGLVMGKIISILLDYSTE